METSGTSPNPPLTGRDIRLKSFRRTVLGRGFDPVEVDEYLAEVARVLDALHADARASDRAAVAPQTATSDHETAVAAARAAADAIVRDAHAEAARVLADAHDRAREAERLEAAAALRAAEVERHLARRAEGLLEEATRLQRAAAELGSHLSLAPEPHQHPDVATTPVDDAERPLDVFELRRRARASS